MKPRASSIAAPLLEEHDRASGSTTRNNSANGGKFPIPESVTVERLIAGDTRRWIALIGIWLSVALVAATATFVSAQGSPNSRPWLWQVVQHAPYWLTWTLVCPPAYAALHRLTDRRRWLTLDIPRLMGIGVLASLGSSLAAYVSSAWLGSESLDADVFVARFLDNQSGAAFQLMNAGVFVVTCISLLVVRNGRQRDMARFAMALAMLDSARTKADLSEARLRALQAQVQPHFLFNALNNIATLVRTGQSQSAFDGLGQLGGLLRTSFRTTGEPWSTLDEELQFVEQYLALCNLSSEHGIRWRCSVADGLRTFPVPSLLLQPLVENSIKHGSRRDSVLTLDAQAWEEEGALMIELADDGRGIDEFIAKMPPAGHALSNIADRLRLMCGPGGAFEIERQESGGTRVRIRVPRKASANA